MAKGLDRRGRTAGVWTDVEVERLVPGEDGIVGGKRVVVSSTLARENLPPVTPEARQAQLAQSQEHLQSVRRRNRWIKAALVSLAVLLLAAALVYWATRPPHH